MADPKIRYDIEAAVSGEASVDVLAQNLRSLGDTLDGPLKAQAEAAAAALSALEAKRGVVNNFINLRRETETLSTAMSAAAATVDTLGAQLPQAAAATAQFAAAENQARAAVAGAKADLDEQRAALTQLRQQFTGAARQTDEYKESSAQLAVTVRDLRTNLREKQGELTAAAASTKQAARDEKALGLEYRNSVNAAKQVSAELGAKNRALQSSRAALDGAGISTRNLTEAQRNLDAAVAAVKQEVQGMGPAFTRAGQQAVAAGRQQVQATRETRTELGRLADQLRAVQAIAITALGGSFVGGLVRDVAATADEYANLAARIRLVTGEGEAFESALQGVQEIALSTNSELDSTANLFARISQAGRELGLSQQAALSLTETINQSIQLSGGSADSAKAAIIQLVQGLQSGVLRGEEFNSVMEQSPRLARALADGLGRTTGELRELAKQGQLTTDVVLSALQGQAQAVATEFEKLPPTVGRAVQNLSTAWTVYIGEADKATGASQAAAGAINALGQNLDTVIGLLLDAGQAGAAFVALRLAQSFLGLGVAAQTAAAQVAASTAAINAASVAGSGAAANVGRFATILSGLKTFTLLGIVTNFRDIGTFIGESAAKLAGYRDGSEKLTREWKAQGEAAQKNAQHQAALAQAMQIGAERARNLTPEARVLVGVFDELRTNGRGATDALVDLSRRANLQDTTGIKAFSLALRDLQLQGKASGDQIRDSFANALRGEDLVAFVDTARTAFQKTRDESALLATVLDASLREAIRRSGAEFSVISGGMGAAARSAISDTQLIIDNLARLKTQGVDTAKALSASLGAGIETADSQASIEALRSQVEAVRRVIGDQVADTFLDQLATKAREVTREIGGVSEAFRQLGIQTKSDLQRTATDFKAAYDTVLKSGEATADGLQAAFARYASAAIAANGGVVSESLKTEAAIRGMELATDRAGRTIVRAMGESRSAVDNFRRGVDQASDSAKKLDAINAKYARPEGGSIVGDTREERLAGQNAVDNSLQFSLREKLRAGTLSSADEDDIRAVVSAMSQNERIDASVDQLSAGAFSNEGQADRLAWRGVRNELEGFLETLSTQSMRTVRVQLDTTQGRRTVNTDEEGAQALIRALQDSSRAAGR